MYHDLRHELDEAAARIAANRDEKPASPSKAFRKLFLQERRDWNQPGAPRVGWKRGEFGEVVLALFGQGNLREEWGDVGYYVAQTWAPCWLLYAAITPKTIIEAAVAKFERRAAKGGTR